MTVSPGKDSPGVRGKDRWTSIRRTVGPKERMQPLDRFSEALVYATRLHADQRQKVSGDPYVGHLLRVAGIALGHGADEDRLSEEIAHGPPPPSSTTNGPALEGDAPDQQPAEEERGRNRPEGM